MYLLKMFELLFASTPFSLRMYNRKYFIHYGAWLNAFIILCMPVYAYVSVMIQSFVCVRVCLCVSVCMHVQYVCVYMYGGNWWKWIGSSFPFSPHDLLEANCSLG